MEIITNHYKSPDQAEHKAGLKKNKKINKSIEKKKDTLIEITQIKSIGQSVPHLAKSF